MVLPRQTRRAKEQCESTACAHRWKRSTTSTMSMIRHIEIRRFRGIAAASWSPRPGINALIGGGDSGKSTILDAIDLALAARRNAAFTDADFYNLDVSEPIDIRITLGDLPPALLDLERYAPFLRGWDDVLGILLDEPVAGSEAVLTMRLLVTGDLEPSWHLFSERAEAEDASRDLPYAERLRLAPTRLGAYASHHFSWGARSVLNRLSDERANASTALAAAAREARSTFGDTAGEQVPETLKIVHDVAREAGVRGGEAATALLDAHGISFSGGVIALHDENGVPLRNLGIGSSRLLVASLQARTATDTGATLIDELEHGLEPYRITRLLHALGSKDGGAPRQTFLTTHSPIAVRELSAQQLVRVRKQADGVVSLVWIGASGEDQATLRACAEAFLAPNVIVCEGSTEIGLLRGLDLWWNSQNRDPVAYYGVATCDGGGANMLARATCFGRLGYRTSLFRDSDVVFTPDQHAPLNDAAVSQIAWQPGMSTEQALFDGLPDAALGSLVMIAVDHLGIDAINQHAKAADAATEAFDFLLDDWTPAMRAAFGKAAGKGRWYKMVDPGERVGREILGPHLTASKPELADVIDKIRAWIENAPAVAGDVAAPAVDDDFGL